MDASEQVVFEDYFYKYTKKHKLLVGKKDKWKQKYFRLKKCGDKPVLEYFNKKPKSSSITPKERIELWPSFRVEKSLNTKSRQISFEITLANQQLSLSCDSKDKADLFVFLLQIQCKLKNQIQDDIFYVEPVISDDTTSIGCKGASCLLHVSPCGLTLALKESRSILAQWPLKCIRWFETSGDNELTLEAGRVAPMGDGVYNFLCSNGENTKIYDILDRYIIDTLDRAKPHRKGSPEEIEDYLDEFQRLHSLAIVSARVTSSPEVSTILKETWRHVHPDLDKKTDEDSNIVVKRKKIVHSHEQTASIGLRQSQYNPKSIQPPPLPSMPPTSAINSSIAQNNESILTARPPAPPRPPGIHKAHNSNATRTQHSRQRRSSSASSLNSQGSPDQPAYLKMLADDSDDFPPPPPEAFLDNQLTNSSYYEGTQTTGRVKSSLERRRQAQSLDNESQKATSCEDLRSSKKNMVFHRPDSVDSLDVIVAETDENMNHAKPPVPFPKLQAYKGTDDKFERDRSQSIDYYNVRRESAPINSPSPSARHIRKILAQKRQTSHDVLRKSNSNPNFLNLGSKQDLRALSNGIRSPTDDSPTLSHKNKHASRSLASLLPGNIRRAISRERVPGDMVDSRSNTPTHSRSNSVDRSSMRRKRSNSVRGPNIKSITKTEKTRSFRREKSFKPNVQTTEQSINNQNGLPRSLTVINGQAINVSADVANNNMQAKPERRRKLNLSFGPADRIKNLPSPEREETRC